MAKHISYDGLNSLDVSIAEIEMMAKLLKKRYGRCAEAIASYFALEHETIGDDDRSKNWQRVATLIQKKRFNR